MAQRRRRARLPVAPLAIAGALALCQAAFAQDEPKPPPPPNTQQDLLDNIHRKLDPLIAPVKEHLPLIAGAFVILFIINRVMKSRGKASSNQVSTSGLFGRWRAEKKLAQLIAEHMYEDAADLTLQLDPNKVTEAADLLMKGKRYARAASMFMERRLPKRAAACYERGEQYDLAAELYEKNGDYERAEECYLKVKNKAAIARMFAQQGKSEKAAHYFKELGRPKDAGEHFEKLGKKAEAAEQYAQAYQMLGTRKPGSGERDIGIEKEGKEILTKLCKLWDELGQSDKAAEFLLKAGNAEAAAEYFRKSGKLDKAAKLLEEAGHLEQAARLYKELGKEQEATALFARSFQDRGQIEQAAELYVKNGEILMAAELYEKAEKTQKAAELFLQAKDPRRAADLFAKLGDYAKAAGLYEQGKQWSAAVFCYEQLGQWIKVGEMWERIGNAFLAGVTYFTCKEPQRAVKALAQVPETSDDHKESRRLLAIMLLELGRAKEALPHFDAGFGQKIVKDDVEAFYYYAQALEQFAELHKKALSAYETIEKLRPAYRDVKKRMAALKTGKPLPATSIYADGQADPTSLFHTSRFSLRSTGERARPSD